MKPDETSILVRLAQRRFRNFSEAADSVLETLTAVIPGVVALGQLEPDDQVQRLIEARGEGVSGLDRGAVLSAAGSDLDPDSLRLLGAQAWINTPLEMSDGRIVGVLLAAEGGPEAYSPEHAALLGVAARLLSQEWESVEMRSELRRLRVRVNAGPTTDADTGLPDREGFLGLLDQEWRLVQRGTVESVLVVCRVDSGTENGEGVNAKDRLALKLAAEVLVATARDTDRVGRVGESTVGAILVGCQLRETPAFVARFLGAIERVTQGGQPELEITCGVQSLAAASPTEVLDLAEIAAREPRQTETPALVPQALE